MTDKTKMSNLETFQELSIKITCLDMKLNKIIELLNKPEVELTNVINFTDHKHVSADTTEVTHSNPPQWPNESHTDYLKRIGQYNEAQSIDEFYGETYK